MKTVLVENVFLSFRDIYELNKLFYKRFDEWDAFKDGVIDKDGKILKSDELSNAEMYILNIKKLILSNARVRGNLGQDIFDYKVIRFIDFLHETQQYKLYNTLTENQILKLSINKEFSKIINNYIKIM